MATHPDRPRLLGGCLRLTPPRLPASQPLPDGELHFDAGSHYLPHTDVDSLIEQVAWAKSHPQQITEMALAARQIIADYHTYETRINTLLTTLQQGR